MTRPAIKSATRYEAWLRQQLDGDLDEQDLEEKHRKMAGGAFQFLRATYWRWAETILDICAGLEDAPQVLAVGDIHVENFGTWRDAEGRLIWGVNDFDEAATMPYGCDVVRLATSAILAGVPGVPNAAICRNVLSGYHAGIAKPCPHVLDRKCEWLRETVVVSEDERKAFWQKFDPEKIREKAEKEHAKGRRPKVRPAVAPPEHYQKVLKWARPDRNVDFEYFERTAGTGSLGRPRYFGVGTWRGDLIVREAKAIVPSGWVLAHRGSQKPRCPEIASGRHRSPDPFYCMRGRILVRRLSPNDFKIEVKDENDSTAKARKAEDQNHKAVSRAELVNAKMLHAMGRDLGSIHRGTPARRKAITADLERRGGGWLLEAANAMADFTTSEWKEWRTYHDDRAQDAGG